MFSNCLLIFIVFYILCRVSEIQKMHWGGSLHEVNYIFLWCVNK